MMDLKNYIPLGEMHLTRVKGRNFSHMNYSFRICYTEDFVSTQAPSFTYCNN